MVKVTCTIFMSLYFFFFFFFAYIMYKCLRVHQLNIILIIKNNKEKTTKRARERYQIISKKENKK